MGQSLTEIAQTLRDTDKKVQLIYAFNGVGKTRLSREFKELISPKNQDDELEEHKTKILYYNAFTEDLFYWDNDLDGDRVRKIIIHPNGFTNWVLKEQGQENNILKHFQHYTSDKLTPRFNEEYNEITFSIEGGNETVIENIKISKGEESCLIWCVFYSLLEQVVEVLNVAEEADRETAQFDDLKYVFIDDPVSSLDENHLIELAVNIAELIKSSQSGLKFIITTHNPLFYNVLYNEFNNSDKRYSYKSKHSIKRRLEKMNDGTYLFVEQSADSPFSYHLFLLTELEKAIKSEEIKKYHYNFLRQILEKTSTFLGYTGWKELLPHDEQETYYNRIINLCSHAKHAGEETSLIDDNDKRVLTFLVENIRTMYHFREEQAKDISEDGTI
ncbi:MAG: AAA family ATPase [Tannerella sp.]|jgi:wobble nucleotide-excising tRNase|uniref:AAA family ATPase n=1 Tax=Coprobacter fastidiosus TaxID=1099853 RepID=UPI000F00C514|nr:AAA family ATPase [Coprobacter fastidiosus]MBS6411657.1 AAA family ATPase [Tannerella sp.]RHO61504.1 anticodon nuclease [Tannerella sp. AM09-19]